MTAEAELDWTVAGAFEISPGIHRVPLPLPLDGLRAVNVYVLESEDGLTLIDGGWAIEPARRQLDESLKRIGCRVADITSFLVTHSHRDHYTQAVAIRREVPGISISLGAGERATIDFVRSGKPLPYADRLARCGAVDEAASWRDWVKSNTPEPDLWLAPDQWLTEETTISVGSRQLVAIPTPGHTAGHFVFMEPDAGLLFAGDHVLPTITPSIGFEAGGTDAPLADYIGSLSRVRSLPDLRLLPAHGSPTLSSHARVDELLGHHEHRLALSLAAVRAEAHTARDVAASLPWTRRQRHLSELEPFDAGLAIMETRHHLDVLVLRGALRRHDDAGVLFYECVTSPS